MSGEKEKGSEDKRRSHRERWRVVKGKTGGGRERSRKDAKDCRLITRSARSMTSPLRRALGVDPLQQNDPRDDQEDTYAF